RSAVVVITDRGPYVAGRDLDLSKAAAQAIGIGGVGPVSMEILLPAEPAPAFP
ncbi:MAG: RlpA-like double-psi beta-barrel domain-containing protein, partial [Actinomycetota bacterium]